MTGRAAGLLLAFRAPRLATPRPGWYPTFDLRPGEPTPSKVMRAWRVPVFEPLAGIINDVAAWESGLLSHYDRALERLPRPARRP